MRIEYLGNKELLKLRKTAFLASGTISSETVLRCYDWATEMRRQGECVVSGFCSKLEHDVLHFLSKGAQPIIIVLARKMYKVIPEEWRKPLEEKRLLVISVSNATRQSKATAWARNRYICEISDRILFVGVTEKSSLNALKIEFENKLLSSDIIKTDIQKNRLMDEENKIKIINKSNVMQQIIIKNVTILDGVNPVRCADIVIENGIFKSVNDTLSVANTSADVEYIDGTGKFLVPGLWEGHTHMQAGAFGVSAEKIKLFLQSLHEYREWGVTSVVDCGGILEELLKTREAEAQDAGEYADLYFGGPCFTGINGWPVCIAADKSHGVQVDKDTPSEEVVANIAPHVDYIKLIYDNPSSDEAFQMPKEQLKRIIDAAHANGKRAMVHIRTMQDLRDAVNAGADNIEHCPLPKYPESMSEAEEMAELLAENHVCYCPTFTVWEQIANLGSLEYLNKMCENGFLNEDRASQIANGRLFKQGFPLHDPVECRTRLEYGMKSLCLMEESGVTLIAGTDVSFMTQRPGALMRELQLFHEAGLSAESIIRSASSNEAVRFGLKSGLGTIAEGMSADAILLAKDPRQTLDAITRKKNRIRIFKGNSTN